jgi:hypothetical protein
MRQDNTTGARKILLARNEGVDNGVCQRVCNMPAEQSTHPYKNDTNILDTNRGECSAIPKGGHRPDHETTSDKRKRCNTHSGRPGVFMSGGLSPMQYNNNGTGDC